MFRDKLRHSVFLFKNEKPTWCHLLFYFTSYVLNTTQNQPHQISNTQRTENKTTDVVIQQHSRKLLMMDILMSETCWAHKKWNKIAGDIKLVLRSSTITMMRGPINIRLSSVLIFLFFFYVFLLCPHSWVQALYPLSHTSLSFLFLALIGW